MLCTETAVLIFAIYTKQVCTMRAKIKYLTFTVYVTHSYCSSLKSRLDKREVVCVVEIWEELPRDGVQNRKNPVLFPNFTYVYVYLPYVLFLTLHNYSYH
jgi:hypothetical protein